MGKLEETAFGAQKGVQRHDTNLATHTIETPGQLQRGTYADVAKKKGIGYAIGCSGFREKIHFLASK